MTMQHAHLPRAFRVTQVQEENSYTKTFILDQGLAAAPGQFVMVWLPDMDEKPFSLSNADPASLTVAAVGPFSRALHRLKPGDRVWLRGPLGQGYRLPTAGSPPAHFLLVGGGYGVAPLLFLARRLLGGGHQVSVIIGARSNEDLLLVAQFRALGVRLWLVTEDGSVGMQGVASDALSPAIAAEGARPATVYACGPQEMLKAVAAYCRTANLPAQLSWEAHMRCGLGLCGSCEVGKGWLTCLDGPVFAFDPLITPPEPGG